MTAGPFLKWVGGKTALLPRLAPRLPRPDEIAGYREPFLGGGAVFFARYASVRPARLSDRNPDLIAAYVAVRDQLRELVHRLDDEEQEAIGGFDGRGEERFDLHRDRLNAHRAGAAPLPLLERAVSVFVLNRWGFNGLWRERADGQITTPYGYPRTWPLFHPDRLKACSALLQGVELEAEDFASATGRSLPGEFVYLDPPYAPAAGAVCFTGYTAEGFTYRGRQVALLPEALPRSDQERLEDVLEDLDRRGAIFVLSNQPSPSLAELRARWLSVVLAARRSVSADAATRGDAPELLFSNWPGLRLPTEVHPLPAWLAAQVSHAAPAPGEPRKLRKRARRANAGAST